MPPYLVHPMYTPGDGGAQSFGENSSSFESENAREDLGDFPGTGALRWLGTQTLGLTVSQNAARWPGCHSIRDYIPVLKLGPGATGSLAVLTGAWGGDDSSGIPVTVKPNQQKPEVMGKCTGKTGTLVLLTFVIPRVMFGGGSCGGDWTDETLVGPALIMGLVPL